MDTLSAFPDLPPEVAARVAAARSGSAETRRIAGREATGIQQPRIERRSLEAGQRVLHVQRIDTDEVSQAEHRVLALLAEGYSNAEIGEKVCISEETVKSHVRHMLGRCCCRNRAHLAYRFGRGEIAVVLVTGNTKITLIDKTPPA